MDESKPTSGQVTRFDVERHHVGEGDAALAARIAADPRASALLAELKAESARFEAQMPPAVDFARSLRHRLDTKAAPDRAVRWKRWSLPVAAAACAAILALVLTTGGSPRVGPDGVDTVRFKGAPAQVAVVILRDGDQTRHTTDVAVTSGDRVRVSLDVRAAGTFSVGILARDGTWRSLLDEAPLAPGRHDLEGGFRVDDGPTRARVIAGSPGAVRAAIAAQRFDDVTSLVLSAGHR